MSCAASAAAPSASPNLYSARESPAAVHQEENFVVCDVARGLPHVDRRFGSKSRDVLLVAEVAPLQRERLVWGRRWCWRRCAVFESSNAANAGAAQVGGVCEEECLSAASDSECQGIQDQRRASIFRECFRKFQILFRIGGGVSLSKFIFKALLYSGRLK